jgi:hypothetical protein
MTTHKQPKPRPLLTVARKGVIRDHGATSLLSESKVEESWRDVNGGVVRLDADTMSEKTSHRYHVSLAPMLLLRALKCIPTEQLTDDVARLLAREPDSRATLINALAAIVKGLAAPAKPDNDPFG